MFDIPFNLILINPAIDIIIFMGIIFFIISKLYLDILEKKNKEILWLDFKISASFLILGYLNYSGQNINFFNFSLDWYFYIIIIQFFLEGIIFSLNPKKFKKMISKVKKNVKK